MVVFSSKKSSLRFSVSQWEGFNKRSWVGDWVMTLWSLIGKAANRMGASINELAGSQLSKFTMHPSRTCHTANHVDLCQLLLSGCCWGMIPN
ncbi:hypothetical protein NPIL_53891 [Nephila pilipes]|uniref:Uncharacterized protein n=1 Tax=Nephila pilipes TaxID=299642 RepID=A0A8X6PCE3_NEPPI|nr:hypothetical protein NPIL_53891 [Nephila pilipes]